MTAVLAAVLGAWPAEATRQATPPAQAVLPAPRVDMRGGVVTIMFDLAAADPAARFTVALEVRVRGGAAVPARSLAGDLGDVAGGPGKRIVWQALQDIEIPDFDAYEYRVVATPVVLTGGLRVITDPADAAVSVAGEPRLGGQTPLTLGDVRAGTYTITIRKAGFLEHRVEQVEVRPGEITEVRRTLTAEPPTPPPPPPGGGTTTPPQPAPKGGTPKWIIPVVGGGAAGALLALRGGGGGGGTSTPPTACAITLAPTGWSSPPQAGGTQPVTVTIGPANCTPTTWTVTNGTMSNGTPLTGSPSTGNGSGSITVTLQANNTTSAATGSLTVSNGSASAAFTVSGQPGLSSATNTVTGNSATFAQFAGITVVAGQKLTITATGTISTPGNGNVGPQGIGVNAGSQGRLPGAPSFGLICGINGQLTSDLFYAGPGSPHAAGAVAATSGPLFCGMNAPNAGAYTGNSGGWSVTVIIGG